MAEFALSAILYGRSSTKDQVKKILELKAQLVKLGYNPDEVDYMIMSKTRDRDINKLDADGLQELQRALEEQLDIASKCLAAI